VLPTGLNTSTDYFVEKLTNDTFHLTTSVYGMATRVITTGTQSGTHSYLQSLYGLGDGTATFNAPDTRGLSIRALDSGRGIDANRIIGTTQKGTLQAFDTSLSGVPDGLWSVSTYLSETLIMAQSAIGADNYALTDYPYVSTGGAPPTTTQVLPNIVGHQGATGVARASNFALPHIIKY
jgi:phage-related tail fiber protein